MIDDKTPVLVGAGQFVEREATENAPMYYAAQAAARAIEDSGAADIAAHIDTIVVMRLFSDSRGLWVSEHGRSNNPPQSIAKAIGATPQHRIYSPVGGNEPLSLMIEAAKDIAAGKKHAVLIAGAEAIRNQRQADRAGKTLDWNEEFSEEMEDRTAPPSLLTTQEFFTGLTTPIRTYCLFDQARRHAQGVDRASYVKGMAELMAPFTDVAAQNPYSQFPKAMSADEIAGAPALNHMYTLGMVARDGVNMAAAVIMCSAAKARELGIPEDRWVYMHGLAEGKELRPSERPNLATSPMAGMVVDRALELAGKDISEIDAIDFYSCFPCAVSMLKDHLGIAADDPRGMTLTGGLPYFGGPGNNYSLHALAEALWYSRSHPGENTLVTCNGGFLSKHAVGVFSSTPCDTDWGTQNTRIEQDVLEKKPLAENPAGGRVVSYVVDYKGAEPTGVYVMAETDEGARFMCAAAKGDAATVAAFHETDDMTGARVQTSVDDAEKGTYHFTLEA